MNTLNVSSRDGQMLLGLLQQRYLASLKQKVVKNVEKIILHHRLLRTNPASPNLLNLMKKVQKVAPIKLYSIQKVLTLWWDIRYVDQFSVIATLEHIEFLDGTPIEKSERIEAVQNLDIIKPIILKQEVDSCTQAEACQLFYYKHTYLF